MKQRLPSPITRQNFEETWNIVESERRTAKKKYITTKIASFFSNMVFAVLILIAGNGLIHDHLTGSYCDFLETVPYLLPVWEKMSGMVLKPDWSITLQIAVPLFLVYLICFAVCGIFVLIVMGIYHPFKRQLPAGSDQENASQMLTMAIDARRYARRSGANGSMVWALVFMMFQFCLIALYWLLGLKDLGSLVEIITGPILKLLEPYLITSLAQASAQSALFMPALMVLILGIYLAYALTNYLHALSVQFMYKYNVPYSFVAEVEYYYTFADEETEGLTEEEIQSKRRENAESKRTEALELERIGAYGKAKELLAAAAHGGDAAAMEHYARHWLIAGAKDPGRYWLEKCVASGQASTEAQKNLKRLKWHRKVTTRYLKETA